MPSVKKNLVLETTATTGTGTLTLEAATGWARFGAAYAIGDVVPYSIASGDNKEVGLGTVGAGNTLARTTVLATLVDGVYTDASPVAIALTGNSVVSSGPLAELFDAGEISGASSGIATYTWATRPAAAGATGTIIRVSDVGVGGGLFVSDGAYWAPVNGHIVLAAVADAGLFTTSTTIVALAGWSYVIPADLFRKPGSFLRGTITGRRTGTLAGTGYPTIKLSWSTVLNNVLAAANGSATYIGALRGQSILSRVNDTQVRSHEDNGNYAGSVPSQGDQYQSALVAMSATTDITINAYGQVSTTPGAGETIWVDQIMIELLVP